MIIYRDILSRLSAAGWSTYRLQKERQLPNSVIIRIRAGKSITTQTLDTVCRLLKCQPGDVISWVPDTKERD